LVGHDNLRLANDQVAKWGSSRGGPRISSCVRLTGSMFSKSLCGERKAQEETWKIRVWPPALERPRKIFNRRIEHLTVVDNFRSNTKIKGEFPRAGNPFHAKTGTDPKRYLGCRWPWGPKTYRSKQSLTNQGKSLFDCYLGAFSDGRPVGLQFIPQPPLGTQPKDFLLQSIVTLVAFTEFFSE